MLRSFPKTRPPLPDEIADLYAVYYKQNREGKLPASSLSQRMESWLHKKIASDVVNDPTPRATLEIGAGTLNQLNYEPERGPYDIVEPFKALFEGSGLLGRIRNVYADISEVSGEQEYDRITSAATFEHICNLPEVIARAGILLKGEGVLRVSIPSEGRLLWTLGWKLTTGLEFRIRYGLDYAILMKHEHVNTAQEIEGLLRCFFDDVSGKAFGLTKRFSFYQFYACKRPKTERCRDYLDSLESETA